MLRHNTVKMSSSAMTDATNEPSWYRCSTQPAEVEDQQHGYLVSLADVGITQAKWEMGIYPDGQSRCAESRRETGRRGGRICGIVLEKGEGVFGIQPPAGRGGVYVESAVGRPRNRP